MLRCSPRDIRDSADIGSPCVPVVISTTRSGGIISAAAMSRMSESATRRYPSSRAMPMLRTIDRPTNDTRLPERHRGIDDLLHPIDIRREARDDHPSLGAADQPVQRRADLAFRGPHPWDLGIR